MLYKRIISGLLFLPFFYLVTWELPPVYFAGLVLAAAAIGQYEFYRMVQVRRIAPNPVLGILIGAFLVAESFHPLPGLSWKLYAASALVLVLAARLFSPRPVEGAIEDISVTFLGIFYVALLFSFQVSIRMLGNGKEWLVFLFFVIWASDIGAYSVGLPWGKHRLYEKVSPKKSLEGFAGSLAAAAGMALLCRVWFMPAVTAREIIGIALLLAVTGTVGDLAESLFKRAAGVKDSGGIIPGHGGILDRMDSMLFAAPVLYYYLRLK